MTAKPARNSHPPSPSPKISVLLVDGSYRPHCAIIDALSRQSLPAGDFEVLWIEYYDAVKPGLTAKMEGRANFQVITLGKSGLYHSSYCFNRGITAARGELLAIVDADVLVEQDFLETVWREHQDEERLAMYVFRLDEPKRRTALCLDLEYLKRTCRLSNPHNYGGCLTVRKRWLLQLNGFEQHDIFRTGGDHANGLDVFTRLKNMGMPIMWHPELRLYHPWHPHKPGFQNAYRLQHILISYRAKNLEVLPFNGIDRNLDREIPFCLRARIAAEKEALPKDSG